MRNTFILVFTLLFCFSGLLAAQDQKIDSSKPTNFYPLLDNSLEYDSRESGGNLVGYRAQLIYPPSEAHLFLAELPLLHNDQSNKFGIGDLRLRYFYLPYKNYEEFFGAFGPSIDIFAPTGSYEDGLGSSFWSISPGVTAGLMFADWIQAFPIVSYVYTSKPTTDLIPESQKKERHGLSAQVIIPVVFTEKFFMQITPVFSIGDFNDAGNTSRYIQELLGSYSLSDKLQASIFYRGAFADKDHTFRMGLTVFFL